TGTSTPEATDTPAATQAASATPAGPAPTNTCYGMRYVSDVTIPDNTEMAPGEEFTKTWRVRNSGSCAWQAGFKFAFTGGEAMGGSTVSLANAVQPGAEVNLSVDLTAPTTPGTYRGNWRMSTAGGVFFGDEVFVLIVVESSAATATQGPSSTPTSTSTTAPTTAPTNTPEP
ncbi:MAG: NBR1-Ig-like domain-containing protein, partial [Anaerolineales bacterium]|nr:NBR1-Ig-like domain-containing protein [Anaerolineales bacterium]